MNLVIHLKIQNMEGALERLLGVVRYRGFNLLEMVALPARDGGRMDVTLKVQNVRSDGQNLSRQIAKLFDVESVETYQQAPQVRIG